MQLFVRRPDSSVVSIRLPSEHCGAADVVAAAMAPQQQQQQADLFVAHAGKLVPRDCRRLGDCGISDWSTVEVLARARGGGGDGGATGAESRDCYLKMYLDKKPDKVDPNEARLGKWTRCALSAESLQPPCVMDQLGNIYNKEAVVSALLTKSLPKRLRYIKGLKDLTTVQLSTIPGVDADDEHVETKYQCPVTGQDFNGKFKFVALKGCGHVLSARAFKEVRSTACLVCHAEFKEEDKVTVNGTDEEVAFLRERMEAEIASRKKDKQAKSEAAELENVKNGVKRKEANGGTAAAAAETAAETAAVAAPAAAKKAKPVLPVPAHAQSEVYRSIFTSSGNKSGIKETYSCRALPIGRN